MVDVYVYVCIIVHVSQSVIHSSDISHSKDLILANNLILAFFWLVLTLELGYSEIMNYHDI